MTGESPSKDVKHMKTYVTVTLNSDGGLASAVTQTLTDLGFNSTLGSHDFVYDWKNEVTPAQVIEFVDRVQSKLAGMNVLLHFTTVR